MNPTLIFVDTEVLKRHWLACFIFSETGERVHFHNDRKGLMKFLNQYREYLFIGYNIREYDQWILKALQAGLSPKSVSDAIIKEKRKGWTIFQGIDTPDLNFYDAMPTPPKKLKRLEASAGVAIHESNISFDFEGVLSDNDLKEFINYCFADIENLRMVFDELKYDFDAHGLLIEEFDLDFADYGKTKAQLTAKILKAKKQEFDADDEYNIELPPNLKIEKYKQVPEWFLSQKSHPYLNPNGKYTNPSLAIRIQNLIFNVAWGGAHSLEKPYYWKKANDDDMAIMDMDATTYYPEIATRYAFSRSVDDEGLILYREIISRRVGYKIQKHPLEYPLKIVLNSTYGAFIFEGSNLTDRRQGRRICVLGQLFILDLIEKIEDFGELININTDGIAIKPYTAADIEKIESACREWEERTGFKLTNSPVIECYQRDVNNYIWNENGKIKRKGIYKAPKKLDCEQKIISESVYEYIINGIPIEETINSCTDLRLFQRILDIGAYDYFINMRTGEHLPNKILRVFITKDSNDYEEIKKGREGQKTHTKIQTLPRMVKIINENIIDMKPPEWLDRKFYIDEANKMLDELKQPKKTVGTLSKTNRKHEKRDVRDFKNSSLSNFGTPAVDNFLNE